MNILEFSILPKYIILVYKVKKKTHFTELRISHITLIRKHKMQKKK